MLYGQGQSTGMDQTALGAIETGFTVDQMKISAPDREMLRALAYKVAEIAASERMTEVRAAWQAHNELNPIRPVFFCDPENGWNEIITEAEMYCKGQLARRWEMNLRKKIFCALEMQDDTPIEATYDVPYTVAPDNWGLSVHMQRTQHDGAATWQSPLQDYDRDLERVHMQPIDIDWDTTHACLQATNDAFGDILDVKLKGVWWWSLGITMPAIFLRGLENMMFDFYDHPDELKGLMQRISDGYMHKIDWLENNKLLNLNNDGTYVGSGGYGFCNQLPAADFDGTVRCKDLWGFAESQETVNLSPDMYEEFVFPYEKPILDRFGLNCYGCCEPLNGRWEIVKRHTNMRRLSCSPWADYEMMASELGADYIFSMKVNPADIAIPEIDHERIRSELRRNLEITKGCVAEVIMKDNHTIAGKPQNIIDWCRIAREEINATL